jgi:hypothetical protein
VLRTLLIVTLTGCGSGASIEVLFPNQAALDGTKRLRVELHDPDGEGCIDFAQRVADEVGPRGSPSRSADVPAPFDEVEVEDVPSGAQLVLAYAHSDDGRETPPFLAGCSDKYDSTGDDGDPEDVAVVLEHIPYPALRISEASGNRQVGRPRELLPRPLRVLADATSGGETFVVPGLTIVFRTDRPFVLGDGTIQHTTLSGADGISETTVALPLEPELGTVRASSPALENIEVTFTVAALAEIPIQSSSRLIDFSATPVALAAAEIDGSGVDLIAVGSEGGATRLLVADAPLGGPVPLSVPEELGMSPVGVTTFGSRIAIANRRIASSEHAEVKTLSFSGAAIVLDRSYVLTASNAVGIVPIARTGGQSALAIAASGRSTNDRPCAKNSCDCPPDELCGEGDVCRAHDGVVLILSPDPARPGELLEEERCEEPITSTCSPQDCCLTRSITCEPDDCGCQVPRRARLGSWTGPLDPRAIAAAALRSTASSELLVPTQAGLHRLDQTAAGFRDSAIFILSSNVVAAAGASIDLSLDATADVAWIESAACGGGSSLEEICPTVVEIADAKGCIGFLLTEQSGPAPDLSPPQLGSCRRHHLSFVPGALCLAQLDDDTHPDVVVSAPADDRIYIFRGDGRGGVLEPPQALEVAGGPMVCADLDGDGTDEIAVADESQPGRFNFLSF